MRQFGGPERPPAARDPAAEPLSLIQVKDPNEALGLAARLLAGGAPLRSLPLGSTLGVLIMAIDAGSYAFARRANRAVGVAAWFRTSVEAAERWNYGQGLVSPADIQTDGAAAIIPAVQAIDAETARFLSQRLRDQLLRPCRVAYYVRDYAGREGRRTRLVRLVRPSARRTAV
ncbi:MAG: hypothetical protein AAGC57_20880 [Pseudomonadota bacterium]